MFQRLANLIRGFFSLFISGLERRNPEALLEVEKENLRKQIAKYNQGLVAHAGLSERLMRQVKDLEKQERETHAKVAANLKAGNREVAGQYAIRLQTVRQQLIENRAQLEETETTYKTLVAARDQAVSAAKAKIEALKAGINDMKMKQAMAELNEMAAGMVSSIGGSGDTLNRLHEMVEEERGKAAGKARVSRDMLASETGDIQMKQAEQSALAEAALEEFMIEEGMADKSKLAEIVQASQQEAQK
jgi:phage shock protein A